MSDTEEMEFYSDSESEGEEVLYVPRSDGYVLVPTSEIRRSPTDYSPVPDLENYFYRYQNNPLANTGNSHIPSTVNPPQEDLPSAQPLPEPPDVGTNEPQNVSMHDIEHVSTNTEPTPELQEFLAAATNIPVEMSSAAPLSPPREIPPAASSSKTPKSKMKKAPKPSPLKDGEDDGQTCSICFESWSISGEHRLASLKCGHLFGKSCVEKWLKAQGSASRCPQCNAKAHKKDIRVLYVKTLKALDTSEKDRLNSELVQVKSEKNALEKEHAKALMKCELNVQFIQKLQNELKMLKASVSRGDVEDEMALTTTKGAQTKIFKLAHYNTICVNKDGDCRVMAINDWMHMLIVSVPSQIPMFPGFGVKKINTLEMKPERYIPLHQKQIRDLAFNPHKQNLLLSVSIDKIAKITNIESNSTIQAYETSSPLWCCSWNSERTNEFFAGSASGKILHFDLTNVDGPIHTYDISGSGSIVSIHYISRCEEKHFYKTGLLVTRLRNINFIELNDGAIKEHELIEGNFTNVCFDPTSNHFLVTSRPNQQNPHVRHTLHHLVCINISDSPTIINHVVSSNEIHTFQGGTTMKALSRADKIVRNPSQNECVFICEESSNSSKLYNMASTSLIQKLYLSEKVLDSTTINPGQKYYLALLTAKSILFYQWIEQL